MPGVLRLRNPELPPTPAICLLPLGQRLRLSSPPGPSPSLHPRAKSPIFKKNKDPSPHFLLQLWPPFCLRAKPPPTCHQYTLPPISNPANQTLPHSHGLHGAKASGLCSVVSRHRGSLSLNHCPGFWAPRSPHLPALLCFGWQSYCEYWRVQGSASLPLLHPPSPLGPPPLLGLHNLQTGPFRNSSPLDT